MARRPTEPPQRTVHHRRPLLATTLACSVIALASQPIALAKPPLTSTGEPLHPITAEVGKPFFDRLQELAGPNAIECGFVPIGKDNSAAVRCAKKAGQYPSSGSTN